MSTSALPRAAGRKRIAAYRLLADMEARGWIQRLMETGERPCRPPVVEEIMMAPATARTGTESAHRLSDCVTALLRDQPFFGSLTRSIAASNPRTARASVRATITKFRSRRASTAARIFWIASSAGITALPVTSPAASR